MGSNRLETVLVGGVAHGVLDAVRAGVGELSAGRDGLVVGACVDHLAVLLGGDAVAGVVSVTKRGWAKERSHFPTDLRIVVAVDADVVTVVSDDYGVGVSLGGGQGHGHEGGKGDDLERENRMLNISFIKYIYLNNSVYSLAFHKYSIFNLNANVKIVFCEDWKVFFFFK